MLSATSIKREIELLIENDITLTIDSEEEIKIIEEEALRQKKEGKGSYKNRYWIWKIWISLL